MKRRTGALIALLLLVMLTGQALAAPRLSDKLFSAAKQALTALSEGDYERVAALLPFSKGAPGPGDWADLAHGFSNLNNPQREYAVAYWKDGWRLAVPLHEPSSGEVEALLFTSDDGETFSGCKRTTWSRVEKEYADSDKVIWNREYVGGSAKVYN